MTDKFLLPSEFLFLILVITIPCWVVLMIFQFIFLKRRNIDIRNYKFRYFLYSIFCYFFIAVTGTFFWRIFPYKLLPKLLPSFHFLGGSDFLFIVVMLYLPMLIWCAIAFPFLIFVGKHWLSKS
jgi:hypothetical protein